MSAKKKGAKSANAKQRAEKAKPAAVTKLIPELAAMKFPAKMDGPARCCTSPAPGRPGEDRGAWRRNKLYSRLCQEPEEHSPGPASRRREMPHDARFPRPPAPRRRAWLPASALRGRRSGAPVHGPLA